MMLYKGMGISSFQSVSGLWDRRNPGSRPVHERPVKFQSVSGLWGPEKSKVAKTADDILKFQSVSSLWDRRNSMSARICSVCSGFNPSPVCGTGEISIPPATSWTIGSFNPSPVCGTGEMLAGGLVAAVHSVSIRLRSVGPEKCRRRGPGSGGWWFQSVSGLWDRRNRGRRRGSRW